MRTRTAALGVSAVIAVAGLAIVAVAWAVSTVSWLFADIPEADNDLLRELTLAAIGVAFVVVGLVGVGLAIRATGRSSSGQVVAAGLLAFGSLLVSVVGAGRVAAQSAAAAVRPALEDAEFLNTPGGDGRVVLLFALFLGAAALGLLLAGSRSPTPIDRRGLATASQQ